MVFLETETLRKREPEGRGLLPRHSSAARWRIRGPNQPSPPHLLTPGDQKFLKRRKHAFSPPCFLPGHGSDALSTMREELQ